MLATQFENFIKDVQGNGTVGRLLGNGIFSVDGKLLLAPRAYTLIDIHLLLSCVTRRYVEVPPKHSETVLQQRPDI